MKNFFTENILPKAALYITILGSLMMLYLAFLLLHPINEIKFVQPFHVITIFTNQGGGFNYEIEYCSPKESLYVMDNQFENIETGELWDVPDRVARFTKGCTKEMHNLPIPIKIDAGIYKLRSSITIKINSLRTEKYDYESESFQIGSY